jgi:hypothetical protein
MYIYMCVCVCVCVSVCVRRHMHMHVISADYCTENVYLGTRTTIEYEI